MNRLSGLYLVHKALQKHFEEGNLILLRFIVFIVWKVKSAKGKTFSRNIKTLFYVFHAALVLQRLKWKTAYIVRRNISPFQVLIWRLLWNIVCTKEENLVLIIKLYYTECLKVNMQHSMHIKGIVRFVIHCSYCIYYCMYTDDALW